MRYETAEWKALEVQPFNLDDVPSGMEWCVYPEERARGAVMCPKSVYLTVLALRWILTYTDQGLEDEFETWKVYWKSEGWYGFTNHIYLFREKVEQYDYLDGDEEPCLLQPLTWVKLATLECRNGRGIIDSALMPGAQPYGGNWHLDGVGGVRRLLEDAMTASSATDFYQPISRREEGWTSTYRVERYGQEGDGCTLRFKLECDHTRVTDICLETQERTWGW